MKLPISILLVVALVGCGSSKGSSGNQDSGATDSALSDAASDGSLTCAAGVSCTGFPSSGFATDANAVANCAGFVHRTDCCGARRVFGINHGERTALCPAEASCVAQYPAVASCSDTTITTDTNETTTNLADVRVRCASGGGPTCQCETFLCTSGACLNTSVDIGSCGP